MKLVATLLSLCLAGSLTGCAPDDDDRFDGGNGPGSTPWNHDEDVSCTTTAECGAGEVCEGGTCQMARCTESYASLAPLGKNHFFGLDAEISVIADDSWVDAFEPADGGYISSWDLAGLGGKVVDVAGGNLTGERPHTLAAAIEFSDEVQLSGSGGSSQISIGIWPRVLATGDVDADGVDELVALGDDGSISLCHVDEGTCTIAQFEQAGGKDVAVADVDGDGFDEPVFLLDLNGESTIIVWNVDAAITGQEESYGWTFNFPIRAIGAGHVSGASSAEVVALEDGGWWGLNDDTLYVFSPASESFIAQKGINGHTVDVAVGDRNSDDQDEVAILHEGQTFELMYMDDQLQLQTLVVADVTVGSQAQRISFVDWNGDSASGRLLEGPELIAGQAVPIAALMFPPYPYDAAGSHGASVLLGDTTTVDETYSDTISLGVGLGVSFGAEAFGFKAKVGAYLNKDFSYTESITRSYQVGTRFSVEAQPDLYGTGYAPIVLSCGCYHRYRYQTEDPAGLIGGSGQTVDFFVPVGGQNQLWSSKRYNAMARASGAVPEIVVPIRVGDLGSYPADLQGIDGAPIASDDMLFPNTPQYQVSDVGTVSFWLVAGEATTNSVAESTKLGVKSSFGGGVVGVDADINVGVTQGYSIRVGTSTIFSGGVPPIPDDPSTPEDEYAVHRYAFQPFVYRQHYSDSFGEDGAYYVLHHAVVP